MTGVTRSSSHPMSIGDSVSEYNPRGRGSIFSKTKVGQDLHRTASDDSEVNLRTTKSSKTKFGRLLRRSLSLINTSSNSKNAQQDRVQVAKESSNSDSSQEIVSNAPSSSRDSSSSEEEEITNAFFFSTTPEEPCIIPAIQEPEKTNNYAEKTVVKAVKVVRVHSQKTPHIRLAVSRLSQCDYRSLPRQKDYTHFNSSSRQSLSLVRSASLQG